MVKQCVMIVDDDAGLLAAVSTRCKQMGLDPVVYSDLSKAMERAETLVPDLILLDIDMPDGDGLDACERLATDERLMTVPVVMLTGNATGASRRRAQQAGARYVRKGAHLWARLKPVIERELGVGSEEEAMSEAG